MSTSESATKKPSLSQPALSSVVLRSLLLLLLCTGNSAKAEGLSLILNGKSFHKEQPKKGAFNEKNWGLGLQYDYKLYNKHWLPYLTASGFRDSFKRNSYYAGGGLLRRFSLDSLQQGFHFGAGVVGFVMVRKDINDRKPFLGALPAFTLGTDSIAINASYVPKVEPKLVPLWFIQLKLSFDNF